jgi:DNA polymerase III subunit beta
MKVSCLQENLTKGLSIVGRAVASKSTLPVLSNILMATDEGRLKLAATNLELAVVTWIGAKVEDEGAITIPARLLAEFVTSLPNDRIDMELNVRTHTVQLSCPSSQAHIKGIDASEFPPIPTVGQEGETVATVKIEPDLLREVIGQVAFAAATDESRPVLAGVLVTFADGELTMAATDGFRLSVRTAKLPVSTSQKLDVLVPARTLNEVARLAADEKEPIEITVTPNNSQILFHMSNIDLVSRLIEGAFPNYRHIIPQGYKTRSVLSTGDFLNASRRASLFAREAANIIRLSIQPGEELVPGRISVTATSAEVGDNVNDVDAVVEGDGLTIAFNARYLTEVLGALTCQKVGLETNSATNPGVLRPVGDDGYIHVIMPLQLSK